MKGFMGMKLLLLCMCIVNLACAAGVKEEDKPVAVYHLKSYPAKIPEVVELWSQGRITQNKSIEREARDAMTRNMINYLNDSRLPVCLVALKGAALVGMVRLVSTWVHDFTVAPMIASHPEWYPWIAGLLVPIPHRNKGIGLMLLEAAHKKAKALGYRQVYLGIVDEQLAWHLSYGYQKIAEDSIGGTRIHVMRYAFI